MYLKISAVLKKLLNIDEMHNILAIIPILKPSCKK